jgi:dTDP-4-amino-4,6-dideoxygalactose transaminase
VHYPLPAHLQGPYAQYGGGPGTLPQTERLAQEVLSLPIYPELSDDDVDYVISQVRAFSASYGA